MRIHVLTHASFEKLGAIESWISQKNYQFSATHTYQYEKLPDVDQFDFLIIMGGPQSSLQLDKYPYLLDEINLTKQAIEKDKTILGICLGAQIIGEALGAKAQRSPHKEIGVHPIELTTDAKNDSLFKQFPQTFNAMHWHNDMPGIHPKAKLLAKSAGCPHQAFSYGERVYGFQFHLEMTKELVACMVEHCATDLNHTQFTQNADEILLSDFDKINEKMFLTLDHLEKLTKSTY